MSLATMNWKRGLLRLWAVVSVVFICVVSLFEYRSVITEFEKVSIANAMKENFGEGVIPFDCGKNLRGVRSTDYVSTMRGCWFGISKFRTLYPEYNDISDIELKARAYLKVPSLQGDYSPPNPRLTLFRAAIIAFIPPLLLLALGYIGLWVGRGFKRRDADEK